MLFKLLCDLAGCDAAGNPKKDSAQKQKSRKQRDLEKAKREYDAWANSENWEDEDDCE